jgi:hypothetical protein
LPQSSVGVKLQFLAQRRTQFVHKPVLELALSLAALTYARIDFVFCRGSFRKYVIEIDLTQKVGEQRYEFVLPLCAFCWVPFSNSRHPSSPLLLCFF